MPVGSPAGPPVAEQTLWSGTPSRTLLAGHLAGIVLVLVGLPLVTHLLASASGAESGEDVIRFGWIATALLVVVQSIAFVVAWIRLRSTLYTVTNQRVIIEKGVFSKALDEIDLRYIDDSLFAQSLAQRMMRIGDVTLISSDKTTPRYVLRSVGDPRKIREMIRSAAYQMTQRQIFTRTT
jgi:uncharacterized membrane protein YdbT with pleckstrin-like domain